CLTGIRGQTVVAGPLLVSHYRAARRASGHLVIDGGRRRRGKCRAARARHGFAEHVGDVVPGMTLWAGCELHDDPPQESGLSDGLSAACVAFLRSRWGKG